MATQVPTILALSGAGAGASGSADVAASPSSVSVSISAGAGAEAAASGVAVGADPSPVPASDTSPAPAPAVAESDATPGALPSLAPVCVDVGVLVVALLDAIKSGQVTPQEVLTIAEASGELAARLQQTAAACGCLPWLKKERTAALLKSTQPIGARDISPFQSRPPTSRVVLINVLKSGKQ